MPTYRVVNDETTMDRAIRGLRPAGPFGVGLTALKLLLGIALLGMGVLMAILGAPSFSLIFALILVALGISSFIDPWLAKRRLRKSQHYRGVVTWHLHDSGFAWKNDLGQGQSSWPTYARVIRKHDGFAVYSQDGGPWWFDDADLVEGTPEEVGTLLRAHAIRWDEE